MKKEVIGKEEIAHISKIVRKHMKEDSFPKQEIDDFLFSIECFLFDDTSITEFDDWFLLWDILASNKDELTLLEKKLMELANACWKYTDFLAREQVKIQKAHKYKPMPVER